MENNSLQSISIYDILQIDIDISWMDISKKDIKDRRWLKLVGIILYKKSN